MNKEGEVVSSSDGGEAFLKILSGQPDIKYIFFNPGSDYYPILEHLSKYETDQNISPKPVLCLSEHLALAMAHGYSMLTRKAQVVMVHVGLGTLQLGGALHNAYRGRAPVLIVAGRAPYTIQGEKAGGRDRPYHWDQELYDQLGLVREFAKWTYELKTNANIGQVVSRAIQISNTEAQGPVYLVLPRELLAEDLDSVRIPPTEAFEPCSGSIPDHPTLEKIADILLSAEDPLILTEYLGRNASAVKNLVELSECIACPVIEPTRKRMNFPTRHPHYLAGYPKDVLESSDAIMLLDIDVPWAPSKQKIRSDVKIVQIDVDPTKSGFPVWGFPVDVSALGSTEFAIQELVKILKRKTTPDRGNKIKERSRKLSERHDEIRANIAKKAVAAQNTGLRTETLFDAVNKFKDEKAIVMGEGVTYEPLIEAYLDCSEPCTFFSSGGSNLGDGLGNALGLKLASPNQEVIALVGDGAFVYSNPTAVFWTARKYGIGTINIIINNGGYRAMKGAVERGYPEGVSKKKNHFAGSSFTPNPPNYVAAAEASGAKGWRVENVDELKKALDTGRAETRKGVPCVIDAVVEQI